MYKEVLKLAVPFLVLVQVSPETLQQVKENAEQDVRRIAAAVSEAYANRCSRDYLSCAFQSYNGCKGTS